MEQENTFRRKQNFKHGKIYIIRNTLNDLVYIGSTCQSLSQRMVQHRRDMNTKRCQEFRLYCIMRELHKDNFYIELLESYPCNTRDELHKREGEYIREYQSKLNKQIAGRTDKEYREVEEHKEKAKLYIKAYQEANNEKLSKYQKEYREEHKDKTRAYNKLYQQENQDKIRVYNRFYQQNNNEKKKEWQKRYIEKIKDRTHTCLICNCCVSWRAKARHEKTLNHQNYLNNLNKKEIKEPKASTMTFYQIDYDEDTGIYS